MPVLVWSLCCVREVRSGAELVLQLFSNWVEKEALGQCSRADA